MKPVSFFGMCALGLLMAVLTIALTACAGPVVKERVVTRNVPVVIPCVSGHRPATVTSLKDRYPLPQWQALTPSQKAAIVGAQALRRQTYGDAITAATAGCN